MLLKEILQGNKVYLTSIGFEDDINLIVSWLNNKELSRYLETRFFVSTLESQLAYISTINDSLDSLYIGIFDNHNSELIGTLGVSMDFGNRISTLGILIGRSDYSGKGFGSDAIKTLTAWLISVQKMRKVCAGVIAENQASLALFKKCGFSIEGTLRKQVLLESGSESDVVRLAFFP